MSMMKSAVTMMKGMMSEMTGDDTILRMHYMKSRKQHKIRVNLYNKMIQIYVMEPTLQIIYLCDLDMKFITEHTIFDDLITFEKLLIVCFEKFDENFRISDLEYTDEGMTFDVIYNLSGEGYKHNIRLKNVTQDINGKTLKTEQEKQKIREKEMKALPKDLELIRPPICEQADVPIETLHRCSIIDFINQKYEMYTQNRKTLIPIANVGDQVISIAQQVNKLTVIITYRNREFVSTSCDPITHNWTLVVCYNVMEPKPENIVFNENLLTIDIHTLQIENNLHCGTHTNTFYPQSLKKPTDDGKMFGHCYREVPVETCITNRHMVPFPKKAKNIIFKGGSFSEQNLYNILCGRMGYLKTMKFMSSRCTFHKNYLNTFIALDVSGNISKSINIYSLVNTGDYSHNYFYELEKQGFKCIGCVGNYWDY